MNSGQTISPETFIKTATIIHSALLLGQALFAIMAFVVGKPLTTTVDTTDPLLIVVPLVALTSLFAANLLYKKLLTAANEVGDLTAKLGRYQTAMIVRCALIEGSSLLAIVAFLLNGSIIFIAIAIGQILYFLTFRPTKDRVAEELQLSYEEQQQL